MVFPYTIISFKTVCYIFIFMQVENVCPAKKQNTVDPHPQCEKKNIVG